jgi:hypothetical protein
METETAAPRSPAGPCPTPRSTCCRRHRCQVPNLGPASSAGALPGRALAPQRRRAARADGQPAAGRRRPRRLGRARRPSPTWTTTASRRSDPDARGTRLSASCAGPRPARHDVVDADGESRRHGASTCGSTPPRWSSATSRSNSPGSGRRVLVPMNFARISRREVKVQRRAGQPVRDVPATRQADIVTLLEEEKIWPTSAAARCTPTPAARSRCCERAGPRPRAPPRARRAEDRAMTAGHKHARPGTRVRAAARAARGPACRRAVALAGQPRLAACWRGAPSTCASWSSTSRCWLAWPDGAAGLWRLARAR